MRFQTTPAVESVFRGLSPGEKWSTTPTSPSRRDQRSSRPDDPVVHGHDAGRIAQERRFAAVAAGTSFISETVLSHPSKLDLVPDAAAAGYFVYLYVLVVPEDLAVIRVGLRVEEGGHDVPEDKIRLRHRRLWEYVAAAVDSTYEALVVDSRLPTFSEVARFRFGQLNWVTDEDLSWLPDVLKDLLRSAI